MLRESIEQTQTHLKASSAACEADHALLRRIAARDRVAFEILYAQYAPRVSRFLTRLLEHEDLIEEVRNDVMLAVWQHAGRFKRVSRPSTWIFGIARYKALYARRRAASRPVIDIPLGTETREPIDWEHPETITLRQEYVRSLGRGRSPAKATPHDALGSGARDVLSRGCHFYRVLGEHC